MDHQRPRVLLIGHSHTVALEEGLKGLNPQAFGYEVIVLELSAPELASKDSKRSTGKFEDVDHDVLLGRLKEIAPDIVLLCMYGNQHNVFGIYLVDDSKEKLPRLKARAGKQYSDWLGFLVPALSCKFAILLAPPPFEDIERQCALLGENHGEVSSLPGKPAPAAERLQFWKAQCDAVGAIATQFGIPVIDLPGDIFNPSGFLREDCWSASDLSHGNALYGRRVMAHTLRALPRLGSTLPAQHPYQGLPDYRYWRQAISDTVPSQVDPVVDVPFRITPVQRVATAGSCFARHISQHLRHRGFNFIQAESVDAPGQARQVPYEFSARYGNIYTSRQLLQLFDRAAGTFVPEEQAWQMPNGNYCDPFRPRMEPEGFESPQEVAQSTQRHLQAVREMFRSLDVFVFTLGLTECWVSHKDGAVFPLPPGVAGGIFEADNYRFHNLGVAEVIGDLAQFMDRLRSVNPEARVILTVSPVPLVATGEDRHVLVSTTYSKSVLRVAADETARTHPNVMYFPAYEIITGQHIGNGYYAADRRDIDPRGVRRVMELFDRYVMQHVHGESGPFEAGSNETDDFEGSEERLQRAQDYADAQCEEELLRRR
jgi:hypothetical protein